MKIATWNINGLRSVFRNGFEEWLLNSNLDILCVQEIKIDQSKVLESHRSVRGYRAHFNHAVKKGYAGVGIYSKHEPLSIKQNVFSRERFHSDGRSLLAEFKKFSVLNVYMPHGGRDKSNLAYKLEVYKDLLEFIKRYEGKPLIIAGDFNIAHDDIDLARPKQNRKNIMFTESERMQMSRISESGYMDAYRDIHPSTAGYTWWPYMAHARERNIGWRIDYLFFDERFRNRVTGVNMLKNITGSDHCPVLADVSVDV